MMRHDSASVISSLQMDYGDSDEEESERRNSRRNNSTEGPNVTSGLGPETDNVKSSTESEKTSQGSGHENDTVASNSENEEKEDGEGKPESGPDALISDDEDGEHPHHHHRHHHHQQDLDSDKEADRKYALAEAVSTDSPSSQTSQTLNPGKKAARLVSYGPDEDLDEDESSDSDEKGYSEDGSAVSPDGNIEDNSTLSRSVQNLPSDEIKIPPEPIGKCPYQLQKKIEDMYERMRRESLDLNRVIQSKKNFRNPSIYEKLLDFCRIDEQGTNFPPEIYDPHIWGKESFYDELDKVQRKELERREKEKKTKIEFMMGTKKPTAAIDSASGPSDEKKRKTKWDAQPMQMIQVSKLSTSSQNPGVVNLTAVATGTKATVISAVGSLTKKNSASGK